MTKNQTESLHATRVGNVPASLIPLLLFAGVVAVLAIGLTLNPREVPSPLIGKPVPEFALPPVKGRSLGLSGADLKGEVSLVNVFASWCVACRDEHPILMNLRSEGLGPIHGLNYKDRPENAAQWLDTLGDPYTRTGADLDGRVAIDLGVYGVPRRSSSIATAALPTNTSARSPRRFWSRNCARSLLGFGRAVRWRKCVLEVHND